MEGIQIDCGRNTYYLIHYYQNIDNNVMTLSIIVGDSFPDNCVFEVEICKLHYLGIFQEMQDTF